MDQLHAQLIDAMNGGDPIGDYKRLIADLFPKWVSSEFAYNAVDDNTVELVILLGVKDAPWLGKLPVTGGATTPRNSRFAAAYLAHSAVGTELLGRELELELFNWVIEHEIHEDALLCLYGTEPRRYGDYEPGYSNDESEDDNG